MIYSAAENFIKKFIFHVWPFIFTSLNMLKTFKKHIFRQKFAVCPMKEEWNFYIKHRRRYNGWKMENSMKYFLCDLNF